MMGYYFFRRSSGWWHWLYLNADDYFLGRPTDAFGDSFGPSERFEKPMEKK